MKKIKTLKDGWDCVPELTEIVLDYDSLLHYIYEIRNCVRQTELNNLVTGMKEICENMVDKLNNVDIDREFETHLDKK